MDGDRQPILSEKVKNEILDGLFSRTLGVLSKDILTKHVLVVGIGSVGSYISEQLIRSGVGQLTAIDPDIVEYSNLSRTIFTLHDVGKPKVEGLSHKLYQINPTLKLQTYQQDINDFDAVSLKEIFTQADVVVAATDDPGAQRLINRFAYGTGKPAVFIGLYQGAEGGEVILSIPEKTACYQCSTSIRHELEQNAGKVGVETDYGTGKLEGVIALGADIHHVTSAAVKMILSLLVPEESNVKLKGFVSEAIEKEFTYLTFSMKDQYWFYPHLFNGVPGQHAYQSVWLTPTRKEDCPICGKVEERTGLTLAPVTTPSAESIRKAFT